MALPFLMLTLIWMQVQQICRKMVQRVLMKYIAQDGYVQSKNVATYFKVRFIHPKV